MSTSAAWSDINFDSALSASIATNSLTKIAIPQAAFSGSDANAVRSFTIAPAAANAVQFGDGEVLSNFTTVSASSVVFILNRTAPATPGQNANFVFYWNKSTDFNTRGDFEDRSGAPSVPNAYSPSAISIPEVNVGMRSETISAKTRKLKAQWTPEFAQDLNAYHALDAEAELTGILSEHVSLEIDLEVMDMLIQNAPTTEYWSARVGATLTVNAAGTVTYNPTTSTSAAGQYYTQMTWFQTLGIKLQKISNLIHQRTLRGGANFMVVSPTIATILESIPGFAADTDGAADTMKYAFGVQKIGALNSRYKVYKNPYMTENVILMGFRGTQFLECGAVYAPYVPLIMTPLVYDPNTFTPRKGLMTRYAKKMLRPEFYGKIYINGLNTL